MLTKWTPTAFRYASGCIRRFKAYIEEAPIEVEIAEFQAGIEAHDAIEQYLTTKNTKYLEGFSEALKKDLNLILSYGGKLEVEKELEADIIKGVADIVIELPASWVVIDIKSRYENDITNEDMQQLYSYLYMLQKENEKSDATIGILSVWNAYSPLKLQKAQHVSIEDLEAYVKKQIEKAEKNIQHGRINTAYCKYCNYILSCDYKFDNSIEDIAREYLQLRGKLIAYEQYLRKYVETTGKNIEVDGLEIGMHERNTTQVDMLNLIRCLKSKNIDFIDCFRPNIARIKALAKKHDDIANCISIDIDYAFGIKKQGGEKE